MKRNVLSEEESSVCQKGWQGRRLKKCGEEGDCDGFEVFGIELWQGG